MAAALTGVTPDYGFHRDELRRPSVTFEVEAKLDEASDFSLLGMTIGRQIEALEKKPVPLIRGISAANTDDLKAFCASLATYGGSALFHMEGFTPEANLYELPPMSYKISRSDLDDAQMALSNADSNDVDFISLGCPHLSIQEIARLAELLRGKQVKKEFWITTARPTRALADSLGYSQVIEASGAKFAVDTCCVVAPIRGRFTGMASDSAKACYYAGGKNRFKTLFRSFKQVVEEALK